MASHDLPSILEPLVDVLRGDYKPSEYGRVILPLLLLRRWECMKTGTPAGDTPALVPRGLADLQENPHLKQDCQAYLEHLPDPVGSILREFDVWRQVDRLAGAHLLYPLVQQVAAMDLSPDAISSVEMGRLFGEMVQQFAEGSRDITGEYYTPPEVRELMVQLLVSTDREQLTQGAVVRTVYDPVAGTGGMLAMADESLRALNPAARVLLFGQELNAESHAICTAEMWLRGQDVRHIARGNTLSEDGHGQRTFDYGLANPPFGVSWKKVERAVRDEHQQLGFAGRFGPGLPRIADGSMLFLLHLVSKMRTPAEGGGRCAIVLSGAPLFVGGPGSGESQIRRWLIENDWLDAIVALPSELFYHTDIATYIWVLSNRKPAHRRGKIQLINASGLFRKRLQRHGAKRRELGPEHRAHIVQLYDACSEDESLSRVVDAADFGYQTLTVEQPLRLRFSVAPDRLDAVDAVKGVAHLEGAARGRLKQALREGNLDRLGTDSGQGHVRVHQAAVKAGVHLTPLQITAVLRALGERDPDAAIFRDAKGRLEPDPTLRETVTVPLGDAHRARLMADIQREAPEAWIDERKTRVGYEIPFSRCFYAYTPPRPLGEIAAELHQTMADLMAAFQEIIDDGAP